jgi:hypothetical protein
MISRVTDIPPSASLYFFPGAQCAPQFQIWSTGTQVITADLPTGILFPSPSVHNKLIGKFSASYTHWRTTHTPRLGKDAQLNFIASVAMHLAIATDRSGSLPAQRNMHTWPVPILIPLPPQQRLLPIYFQIRSGRLSLHDSTHCF